MKKQNNQIIGHIRQLWLAALLTTSLASQAQTPLFEGHTDIGIDYDQTANEWNLHVHDGETDTDYSPANTALLFVKYDAHGFVQPGSEWSFLGTAGSEVWTLPNIEHPNLLFLGIGAEEINPGIFVNDQLTIALKGVSGPGTFAIYDFDSFGNPVVWMNSSDGINGSDSRVVPTGLHQELNWAFSAPGDYTILFEASGNSVANGFTTSGDVPYLFHVEAVPEPGTIALAGVGALVLLLARRKSRN